MAGKKKSFEGLEPIFGEASAELDPRGAAVIGGSQLHRFLFYIHAADSSRLQLLASDFHSLTWERSLTPSQLDDLRDEIGIGGSWSEFLEYFIGSMSSSDVKIVLGSSKDDSCNIHAKLSAHKSKGLPRISVSLHRVVSSLANKAMADLSLALYGGFKKKHNDVAKEREHSSQLEASLKSEKEKSDYLQKQLDALSFLSKRKVPRSTSSDKPSSVVDTFGDILTETGNNITGEPTLMKDSKSSRGSHRVAPVSRRAKVRGASLKDIGDDDNE